MEERYATRPEPVAGVDELAPLLSRLADLDPGSWDDRFAKSVRVQLLGGRALSERQTEILDRIIAKYSDEAMNDRDQWYTTWNADKAERYRIAMGYYGAGDYFRKQVNAYQANPSLIPTMGEYNKVTTNKFVKRVFEGWFSAPKYAVGSMVALGSGATYAQARLCPNKLNLAVIIQENAAIPSSASRGCKVYKLLPVGGTQMFLCEERQLKRARTAKKKKK
jgi:hypothetical protein